MNPLKSFHQYPRPDNVYTHKASLNFDMVRTKIFMDRSDTHTDVYLWLAHGIIGICVATIAWGLAQCEDSLVHFRAETVQNIIDNTNTNFAAYAFYMLFGVALVLIACSLTIFVGPGANGSGIAEIMGMLNGINYPLVISFRTLFTKIFGTLFAVSAGLCIGKEGPLAHIGANVGAFTCILPIK